MKKTIGFLLAVLLIMSMSSFCLASNIECEIGEVLSLEGPFDYDAEERIMRDPEHLAYGRTAYYILYNTDGSDFEPIFDRDYTEKLKMKIEFEMGKDLVKSVGVVKKRIDVQNSDSVMLKNLNAEDGYYYAVALEIKDKQTTSDADIIGTLTFNRKKIDINDNNIVDPFEVEIDDEEFDFNINVFYGGYDYLADSGDFVVTGDIELEDDESYALKFDTDDEVELAFGEDATFLVDVSGQSKLYIKWDTVPVEEIVDANPNAVIDFMNFYDVKFNRSGEFCYEMDNIVAVYRVVDGKLVEIPGANFDTDEVCFKTRVLGNYVFSTEKLVNSAPAVEEVIRPSSPVVSNPNTGAEL